jgi:NAD(P)-dependent dehydrogenase (short-subunit alcohol dehydrogenase family)
MTGVTNPNAALVLISSQASYFAAEWLSSAALEILKNPLRDDFGERINKACEGHDLSLGTEAYGLAKMGVRVLAEEAAVRLGGQGIRVNTISPGIIDTPMVHHEAKHLEGMDAMTQITPLGRWGQPAEIAEAAAFLLSRAASFVTSADLLIDGGSTKPMLSLQRAMANTSSS